METVQAILQAATYILVKDGWEKFTTNSVAERAGVNIASLYQYFPSKEALVVELQRRHVDHTRAEFPALLPQLRAQTSLRGLLRLTVETAVREHSVFPRLHQIFSEELPRSAQYTPPEDELRSLALTLAAPFIRVPDLHIAVFVARVAGHAIIHEAACERPELLKDPKFVEEVVTLLELYLRRPEPSPAASTQQTS